MGTLLWPSDLNRKRVGEALQWKLLVAIAERDRQVAAFKQVSSTIEKPVLKDWKKRIVKWEADPSNAENPYTLTRKGESTVL